MKALAFAIVVFPLLALAQVVDPTPEQVAGWISSGQYLVAGAAVLVLIVRVLSGLSSGWFSTRWGKLALVGFGALLSTMVQALLMGTPILTALITAVVQAVLAIGAYSAGKNALQGNRAT
jgi:MFS family permease